MPGVTEEVIMEFEFKPKANLGLEELAIFPLEVPTILLLVGYSRS